MCVSRARARAYASDATQPSGIVPGFSTSRRSWNVSLRSFVHNYFGAAAHRVVLVRRNLSTTTTTTTNFTLIREGSTRKIPDGRTVARSPARFVHRILRNFPLFPMFRTEKNDDFHFVVQYQFPLRKCRRYSTILERRYRPTRLSRNGKRRHDSTSTRVQRFAW